MKVNFALESGDQQVVSKIIKKPLNLEHVVQLIHYCKDIDLDYGLFFIVGLPDTTLSQMFENYRFLRRIKHFGLSKVHISVATPYPGSQLYKECMEKGYLPKDFNLKLLFIRSFIITTEKWNSKHIKLVLTIGTIYCYLFSLPLLFNRGTLSEIFQSDSKNIKLVVKTMIKKIFPW